MIRHHSQVCHLSSKQYQGMKMRRGAVDKEYPRIQKDACMLTAHLKKQLALSGETRHAVFTAVNVPTRPNTPRSETHIDVGILRVHENIKRRRQLGLTWNVVDQKSFPREDAQHACGR